MAKADTHPGRLSAVLAAMTNVCQGQGGNDGESDEEKQSVEMGMELANYLLFWCEPNREGHCNLEEVAGGASSGIKKVMRHKGWLMDFVYPAFLHFRGQNHCHYILLGTVGIPGQ